MDKEEYVEGEVFYAFVEHLDEGGNIGKERPIVAMKDSENERWLAFKVTSKVDKKINHKYGYLVEDWKESGFTKPSIVKCNREDIHDLEPDNIVRKVGELSRRDLKGLLIKTVRVREIEYRREIRKNKERER